MCAISPEVTLIAGLVAIAKLMMIDEMKSGVKSPFDGDCVSCDIDFNVSVLTFILGTWYDAKKSCNG